MLKVALTVVIKLSLSTAEADTNSVNNSMSNKFFHEMFWPNAKTFHCFSSNVPQADIDMSGKMTCHVQPTFGFI